jgi:hypothetical protein
MKKVRNFILFACAVLASQMQVVYSKNEKPGKNVSQETIEKIKAEDKNLATLLDNALFLVNQIKDNDHNEENRKKAIKNIDDTIKKLSSDIKNKINNDITVIKEESASFAAHRKPLQKYNSNPAQQALERMTSEIKKIAEDRSENVVVQAQQVLVKTISKTEIIEKEATIIINKAQEQLKAGLISPIEAAKIIGEQTYRIDAAKRILNKEAKSAAEKVTQSDMQAGYLSQFSTSVYNLGARALAPLKAGYGYTEEEKEIARTIIIELEKQLELIKQQYKKELMKPLYKNPQKFVEMKKNFELQIQHISNALYEQKIITGEVMSTNRKLFWGAVAAAGAMTAGVLGYQYFMTPEEMSQIPGILPEVPSESIDEQKTSEIKTPEIIENPSKAGGQEPSEEDETIDVKEKSLVEAEQQRRKEYEQGLTGWEQGEELPPVKKSNKQQPRKEELLPGEEETHSWFPEKPITQKPTVTEEEPAVTKNVTSPLTTEEEQVIMSTEEPGEGTVETAATELEQIPTKEQSVEMQAAPEEESILPETVEAPEVITEEEGITPSKTREEELEVPEEVTETLTELEQTTPEIPEKGAAVEVEEGLTQDVEMPKAIEWKEAPKATEWKEAPKATEWEEAPKAMSTKGVTGLEQTTEIPGAAEEEMVMETTETPEELERRAIQERFNSSIPPVVFSPTAKKGLEEIVGKTEQLLAESPQNPESNLEGTQPEEILEESEVEQQAEQIPTQTEE